MNVFNIHLFRTNKITTMDFMLMATTAFLMVALFYASNSFEDAHMRSSRKRALILFRENRENSLKFYTELEVYVSKNDIWSYNAFEDTDITFAELIETLKEKHDIEYSDKAETELEKTKFSRTQIEDCLERLDYEQEFITSLESNIQFRNINFEKQNIA